VQPVDPKFGPIARTLLETWFALPKHDLVPYRSDFDPMVAVPILPVLVILERGSDRVWRFRLAGTEIDRRWDRKVTGHDFTELLAPDIAPIMCRELDTVVDTPCGSWSLAHVKFNSDRVARIEFLRLPLRAKDGSLSLILGCAPEITSRNAYRPDTPLSVVGLVEQHFFDLGAGIPLAHRPVS